MKPSLDTLEDLLALKRHEMPSDGYWQDFLCEFHQRQREMAVRQSGWQVAWSRISGWFSEMSPSRWAYGAGVAYAALAIGFLVLPKGGAEGNPPAAPVKFQVVPIEEPPVQQLEQLDLSPSTQGNAGEQVF